MRFLRVVPIALALAGLAWPGHLAAQRLDAPAPHARVTLIVDSAAVAPNATVWLGLQFALEDGWHIYWRNPGQSGTPPKVIWQAPAFRVTELDWPAPGRLVASGDVSYGYAKAVTLLARGTRTTSATTGILTLSAVVTYVICRDVCVMERATPAIALSAASTTSASANAPHIDDWRGRLPKPMPAAWHATSALTKTDVILTLATGARVTAASFFPADPGVIDDAAEPRVDPTATGATIHFKKSPFFNQAPAALDGVIAIGGHAFALHAPRARTSLPSAPGGQS